MRTWQILLALALILSSAAGLLVMAGGARDLLAPPLQAELNVQDFPTPSGMAVDADKVAAYLARALQERADDDVATRMLLKPDVLTKVKDVVLPRLMNVVAVHRMLEDIPELSALVGLESFKRSVTGSITSANATDDVALTVPGGQLQVEWRADDHVVLTGPAEWEFSGRFDPMSGAWQRESAA